MPENRGALSGIDAGRRPGRVFQTIWDHAIAAEYHKRLPEFEMRHEDRDFGYSRTQSVESSCPVKCGITRALMTCERIRT